MQEIVECLGKAVFNPKLRQSPFFALCIDETTDVSVTKELILYARYLCDGDVLTSFIRIVELSNGMASTIADTICKLCSELGLDMLQRLCGLGRDGASVMLGS